MTLDELTDQVRHARSQIENLSGDVVMHGTRPRGNQLIKLLRTWGVPIRFRQKRQATVTEYQFYQEGVAYRNVLNPETLRKSPRHITVVHHDGYDGKKFYCFSNIEAPGQTTSKVSGLVRSKKFQSGLNPMSFGYSFKLTDLGEYLAQAGTSQPEETEDSEFGVRQAVVVTGEEGLVRIEFSSAAGWMATRIKREWRHGEQPWGTEWKVEEIEKIGTAFFARRATVSHLGPQNTTLEKYEFKNLVLNGPEQSLSLDVPAGSRFRDPDTAEFFVMGDDGELVPSEPPLAACPVRPRKPRTRIGFWRKR